MKNKKINSCPLHLLWRYICKATNHNTTKNSWFNFQLHHISIIYLVPHSSHLTQPLDLVTFSIQKLINIKKSLRTKLSSQADQIRSIIKGIQQASTSENIIAAFESADLFHEYSRNEHITFNKYMPKCIIKKNLARFLKVEGEEYQLENFRIDF